MLGRAPQTKETLPDFCENIDPYKWDIIVWYRVTRNPQEFCRLAGCQRDPRVLGRLNVGMNYMIEIGIYVFNDVNVQLMHGLICMSRHMCI